MRVGTVAVVGAGLVGRGWTPVFTRAGYRVNVYDTDASQLDMAEQRISEFLAGDEAGRIKGQDQIDLVSYTEDLEQALSGAVYVQENAPEALSVKQELFCHLDALAGADTIIGSSTSALDINEITSGLRGRVRCFTAHPFHPAHLLPVVEIMATENAPAEKIVKFLKSVDMAPVVMNKYIPGYIGNRLQAALMREALHIVQDGVADAVSVDKLLTDALALRWVLLGVFGTNHTNSDQGISGYYRKFGNAYSELMRHCSGEPPLFDDESIEEITRQVAHMTGNARLEDICAWRDRMVTSVRTLIAENRAVFLQPGITGRDGDS